jgi:hypothetical protein
MAESSRFLESGEGLIIPPVPIPITDRERRVGRASVQSLNEGRSIAEILREGGLS